MTYRHRLTASRGPQPGRAAANPPHMQRAAIRVDETPAVPPIVHAVLRSPGEPLDADTRAALEPPAWATTLATCASTPAPARPNPPAP